MEPKRYRSHVIGLRRLSASGYELTFERNDLAFEAGRLLTIHGGDPTEDRSYTIASGTQDPHLQVLFRHIPTGKLTPRLARMQAGDPIEFSGPFGEFVVRDPAQPVVFIATGTGVAPCRAYCRSHPALDITVIHGTRVAEDLFYREEFEKHAYHPCVSREEGTGFHGRVTGLVETFAFDPASQFHLCGANEMIFDVQMLLHKRGIDESRVFTEAYYYRLYS